MSNMIGAWTGAPISVKWPCAIWSGIGATAIVFGLRSIAIYMRVDVSGILALAVAQIAFQIGIGGLVLWSSWRFLRGSGVGRLVLEVASWITLLYYSGNVVVVMYSAFTNWERFAGSIEAQNPNTSFIVKLLTMSAGVGVPLVASLLVIYWLRSAASRSHTR
jgi:hypothetical protein